MIQSPVDREVLCSAATVGIVQCGVTPALHSTSLHHQYTVISVENLTVRSIKSHYVEQENVAVLEQPL